MIQPTRFLLIGCGTALVGVGLVGVFLPLLPTTPFLLLAAFLYARSSERFYNWLVGNRWIGEYLRRYYEKRCMTRRHKTFTLSFLWAAIGLSGALAVQTWSVRVILAGVAAAVTTHILLLPNEQRGSEDRDR